MSKPRKRGRDIDGVFLLDKPQGMSSNDIMQKVKRVFQANKAGHTGALDPLATGMLPICLGEATKFSQFLLDADKRYVVTAKLGERTDTSDAEGQVVETRPVNVETSQILTALEQFRGSAAARPCAADAFVVRWGTPPKTKDPNHSLSRNGSDLPCLVRVVIQNFLKTIVVQFVLMSSDSNLLVSHPDG